SRNISGCCGSGAGCHPRSLSATAGRTRWCPRRERGGGAPRKGRSTPMGTSVRAPVGREIVKRTLDVSVALVGLILLLPILLAVAAAVRLTLGSPVIFRQLRPGLHGRPFMLLKFCTMNDRRDVNGQLLPDELR